MARVAEVEVRQTRGGCWLIVLVTIIWRGKRYSTGSQHSRVPLLHACALASGKLR